MFRWIDRLATEPGVTRSREILLAIAGLAGLAALSLLNPAAAVTHAAPAAPVAIAERLKADAAALRQVAGAVPAPGVEFRLWAQSSLGPLNFVVFSHSDGLHQ